MAGLWYELPLLRASRKLREEVSILVGLPDPLLFGSLTLLLSLSEIAHYGQT